MFLLLLMNGSIARNVELLNLDHSSLEISVGLLLWLQLTEYVGK